MIRVAVESVAIFLVPFLVFALYLAARRRNPSKVDSWTKGAVATLALIGLGLTALAILVFGLSEHRPTGAYVPAHMENGRLVPGRFQ